jgi:hypothetical protein
MLTSFSLTLPDMADKLRSGKREMINIPTGAVNHLNLLTGRSDSDSIHHYWHKQAVKDVYNGLQAVNSSNRNYRAERMPYTNKNRGTNQLFFNSPQPYGVVTPKGGGYGNATYSSSLDEKEYEDNRKFLLSQRASGYDEIRNAQPLPPQIPPKYAGIVNNPNMAIRNQIDLQLTSIEDRVFKNIIDSSVFSDLNNITQQLQQVIATIDDQQDIRKIIQRLENIGNLMTIVVGNANAGLQEYKKKDIDYGDSSINLVGRLIDYLKANMAGVGRNESTRKLLAQGTQDIVTQRQYETDRGQKFPQFPIGRVPKGVIDAYLKTGQITPQNLQALNNEQKYAIAKKFGSPSAINNNLNDYSYGYRATILDKVLGELSQILGFPVTR